ncbi:MarR family winged helix-turn-helix transcriptional regulator [Paenibacillus aceti]|uniref:MarR family transcriptional regulator n=1 Tax=Paenibacillus aceti TaxID=1820010 RepID=A0ABQ1W4B5_9BACL|nr:MarR family transcriptional regulator [Paenibacillus aceti]GGG11393.1 MarR family transcriptional regulator [Paenibacillus aceti]
MINIEKQAFIFGGILTLANRLQVLGDKLDDHITLKQWLFIAVISKLEQPAPTITEVAEAIGNSRQSVKKMAALLERQGFVSLVQDEQDARAVRIHLTPKCTAYFRDRSGKEHEFMVSLFDGFDGELTNGLYEGMLKLADNVSRMERVLDEKERG